MPFQTTIDRDGMRVFTRYSGNLTASDVLASIKERFADIDRLKKFRIIIADYTDVESFSTENADVREFADVYLNASQQNSDVVMIAIMPTDHQFGLGRMWEGYAQELPWTHRIFRSMEEAKEWLKELKVPEDLIK